MKRPASVLGTLVILVAAAIIALLQRPGGQPGVTPASGRGEAATARSESEGRSIDRPAARAPEQAPPKDAKAPTPPSIKIGTWNIEWLGQPGKRSGPAAGVAQKIDEMAEYIDASGVDVLALQEILPTGATGERPRSRELDAVCASLTSTTRGQWQYELFSDSPAREDDQLCGVAWNQARVTPIGAQGRALGGAGSDVGVAVFGTRREAKAWARTPHLVRFRVGSADSDLTDFAVVIVHMKSDFGAGDGADHSARREEEARSLADRLPAWSASLAERDIVVLGDTNMTRPPPAKEPAAEIYESALEGLVNANRKNEATHWRGGSMDRIYLPRGQPEFASAAAEVWSDRYADGKRWDAREFKRRLSDHYLVATTLTVMPDDD